jgi:uncharacterized protein (DUF302 family)
MREPVSNTPAKKTFQIAAAGLAAGLVLGIVLSIAGVILLMPGMMIKTHESSLGFEETVAALEQSITDNGWTSPGTMNLNNSMAKHGVEFGPRIRLVRMCKAEYASQVLAGDRHVSSLMPCRVAVWEGDDGKVCISKMNTGLMGKLFGGTIAEVMGGYVAEDEEKILAPVLE